MSSARSLGLLALAACGGELAETPLVEPAPLMCSPSFTAPEAWCGGDPVGNWHPQGVCHMTILTWLAGQCPEGSFELTAGEAGGHLALTSTSIDLAGLYVDRAPMVLDLKRACTRVLGACPRTIEGVLLPWSGDVESGCRAEVSLPFDSFTVGPASIEEGAVIMRGSDERAEFCVENNRLTFHYPRPSRHGRLYLILARSGVP